MVSLRERWRMARFISEERNIIMENRKAMKIVLRLAELGAQVEEDEGVQSDVDGMNNYEAIYQMQDYMNDLMRLEE